MKYNEHSATRRLMRNGINVRGTNVYAVPGTVGIKLLGAIDYLVDRCNFTWIKEEQKRKTYRRR